MLTMTQEQFNFPRPATYEMCFDSGVSYRQLPIQPSLQNKQKSSMGQLLDIVDKFLCFGRNHLLSAVEEEVIYTSQKKTEVPEIKIDNKKRTMNARKRRAKLQIDVFGTQSNTSLVDEPSTATTRKASLLQIKQLVFSNNTDKNIIDSDNDSESDEEITDASELVPEYQNLQMYSTGAKNQPTSIIGFKRSRKQAGQGCPQEHKPNKRVSKNSTKSG